MGRNLIDISILIEAEKQRLNLDDFIGSGSDDEYYVSVITASELIHGVFRAKQVLIRDKRTAIVEVLLNRFPVLGIDLETARFHARLWADLESSGNVIGPHDLWLAATCLAQDLNIVTANVREFRRVPGIEVIRWAGAE